jgi:hypothetical protein
MINKILFNKLNLNLVVIVLLIIVIIPLNLSRTDLFVYNLELFISLVSITLILSCGLIIFSCLITAISLKFSAYSTYSSIVGFLLLWVFIAGIFFPVTGDHDPFFNLGLSINKKYEIVLKAILIILFWFFLKKKDKKNYFLRFIYFFVLTNFVFLLLNIQNNYNKNYKNNLNKFGKKNLIVLSFDGISGHKMYEEIVNNKNFNQSLKDFKLYKNTIAGAPYTNPSINIEINGKFTNRDSKNYYKNILNKKNLDSSVYASYHDVVLDKNKVIKKGELQNYNMYFRINKFFQSYGIGSVGRWGTPLSVFLSESLFYSKIYKDLINLISQNDHNKSNPFDIVKTFEKVDLYEYDIIFDNITFSNNLNDVVRMYHFTFSHWPIVVNENCEEVRSLNDKFDSFEHEQIILKCVSKKIIKFLKNLKAKKIYNNSMIIIKSDHGKPNYIERNYSQKISDVFKQKKYNKYYKKYPYTQKLNNSFYWGFGRYKAFILIKDQNQTKDEIEISDKQVFLHDLSVTYCNFFFKSKECNYSDRNDLVKNENQFSTNNYDIYIPKYENSTTHMDTLKKYQISNNLPFLDSLKLNEIILSD